MAPDSLTEHSRRLAARDLVYGRAFAFFNRVVVPALVGIAAYLLAGGVSL